MDELTLEETYSCIAAMALMGCTIYPLSAPVVARTQEEVDAVLDELAKLPEPGTTKHRRVK